MTARRQRHGFFIIHRHAFEGDTHIMRRLERIRLSIYALRVNVDQPHHHSGQGVCEVSLTGVATAFAIAFLQPLLFRTPINVLFRMPDIFTTKAEPKGFESHRFISHIASQDHQICPANLVAVFFLDRPEQSTCFIKVGVIRPGVQGGKPLITGTSATTSICRAISTRRVPGHTDHETTIMTPVSRPPTLALCHQSLQVFFQRINIQLLEFFTIIK